MGCVLCRRSWLVLLCLAVGLGGFACDGPVSRQNIESSKLEIFKRRLAQCVGDIRRVEFVLTREGPGDEFSRIGPVVVSDRAHLAAFRAEIAKLADPQVNRSPFERADARGAAKICIVYDGIEEVRCRLLPDEIVLWDDEHYSIVLPAGCNLWNWIWERSQEFSDKHPEHQLTTN